MTRRERWILFLLLAAAAAVRLYASWAMRHHLNLHAGTVALMARHIALGREFPTFYYGQAHMGSQEAWLGGLFARLSDPGNGFAVCLGVATIAFALLPIAYAWARNIAGPKAGLAAVAYLVIGPWGLFHYNTSPRGAYPAILVFGALTLWLAAKIADTWQREKVLRHRDFVFLGLAAGQAWWAGQLTTPAILTAAVLLLMTLHNKVFNKKLFSGLAGFLAGSAPFWIYNLRHGWPTFAFKGTFGRVDFRTALLEYFPDRFATLLIPGNPAWLKPVAALIVIGVFVAALILLIMQAKEHKPNPFLLVSILFVPIFAVVFSLSHFSAIRAERYLFPLIPILAVYLGVFTAKLSVRLPAGTAWIPLLILIGMQTPVLWWAREYEATEGNTLARLHEMAESLRHDPPDALYADHTRHAWNYALEEEFVFSTLEKDVYSPNQRRAEEAHTVGFIDGYGNLGCFLADTAASAEGLFAGGHAIHRNLRPAMPRRIPLSVDRIAAARDHTGRDVLDSITDLRADTAWHITGLTGREFLEIRLTSPEPVAGVRLIPLNYRAIPASWHIEGLTEDNTWIDLLPETTTSLLFWSGSRPFWSHPFYRLEGFFDPVTVQALRIKGFGQSEYRSMAIHLLQVMTEQPTASTEPDVQALTGILSERGITRLYTDRWEAYRIHEASGGRIWTPRHPGLYPAEDAPEDIRLTPETALLVRSAEAGMTRQALLARGLAARETLVGPYILLDSDPALPWHPEGHDSGLRWIGLGVMDHQIAYAPVRIERARKRLAREPQYPGIAGDLEAALAANPWLHEARELLIETHRLQANKPDATRQQTLLEEKTIPPVRAEIRFANGIRFLGYGLSHATVSPGDRLRISYFWEVPPKIRTRLLAVFVHVIRDGKILFQDDHVLMRDLPEPIRQPPPRGVVRIDRDIVVPAGISEGPAEIAMGLLDRRNAERFRVRTRLTNRKNAVVLPGGVPSEPALLIQTHEPAQRSN